MLRSVCTVRSLNKNFGEFQGASSFGIRERVALKDIVYHKGVARDVGEIGEK